MAEKKIKIVEGNMYEYEIFDRVDPYSDILKTKLPLFDFSNPPIDPRYLAISLIETMVKYRGMGLAANQVGLSHRVFVMGAEKVGFACFNPEILSGTGIEVYEEGCVSFPGLFIKIPRLSSIQVRYTDMNGVTKEERFDGLTARIFQHEMDHLDGILYTSKVSQLIVNRAKEKVKKNLKKIEKDRKLHAVALNQQLKEEKAAKQVIVDDSSKIQIQQKPTVFEYNVPT